MVGRNPFNFRRIIRPQSSVDNRLNFPTPFIQPLLHLFHELFQLRVWQLSQIEAVWETPVRPRVLQIRGNFHPQKIDALSSHGKGRVFRGIIGQRVDETGFQPVGFLLLGDGCQLVPVRIEEIFLEERLPRAGNEILRLIVELGHADGLYCLESDILGRVLHRLVLFGILILR